MRAGLLGSGLHSRALDGGAWEPVRGTRVVIATIVALVTAALPRAGAECRAGPRAHAVDQPQCDTWSEGVIGPSERSLKPVAAHWSDGEPLSSTDFGSLLDTDNTSSRLSQPGRGMVLDFGMVVSGKIEADVLAASGVPVTFSSSESLKFLSVGGDTQVYGNGDLVYRPGGGQESWHAFARRTGGGQERWHAFARRTLPYLLVTLPQPGWVDFDRIGLYFTAALGPAAAFKGWFQSSEPLLNSIWYHSAYTLQLVTAG